MNKQYLYYNGTCAIDNETEFPRMEKHTDKLDEILIEENVIEELEKELEETNEYTHSISKLKKTLKNGMLFMFLTFLSSPFLLQFILRIGLPADMLWTMPPLFFDIVKVLSIALCGLFGTAILSQDYLRYRSNKKILNGLIKQKESLEETIKQRKQHLEELKQTQTLTEKKEESYIRKINHLEELRKIRRNISLYYDCGCNYNKYKRYYLNNKLEEKLSKKYSNEEIKLIKEYLENSINSELTKQTIEEGIQRKLTK